MTGRFFYSLLSVILLTGVLSCSRLKKPEAAVEREAWLESLNDSIADYQKQKENLTDQLAMIRQKVADMTGDFDYVSNPREVEGYYIYKGWKNRYPLESTGLLARISKSEELELIATLSGGHFNSIAAITDGETVESGIVPHDQALNYRTSTLNKVCFSGSKADSVAMIIAGHVDSSVTIAYLEGKRTGTMKMPSDQKEMVAKTWNLYHQMRIAHDIEKELPRLSGKIAACRRLLEQTDSISDR